MKADRLRDLRQYKSVVGVASNWRDTMRRLNLPKLTTGAEDTQADVETMTHSLDELVTTMTPAPVGGDAQLTTEDLERELESMCTYDVPPSAPPMPVGAMEPLPSVPRTAVITQDMYNRALEGAALKRA